MAQIDIYPSDDTYADRASPDAVRGAETTIQMRYSDTVSFWRLPFFRWGDLSDIPAGSTINSATLYLYCGTVGSTKVTAALTYLTNAQVNEATLTYNNRPCATGSNIHSWAFPSTGWQNCGGDMTITVQNWFSGAANNYGISIWQGSPAYSQTLLNSKENAANKPYLRVVYNITHSETFEGTLNVSGGLLKKINKNVGLAGTLNIVGSLIKKVSKNVGLAGVLNILGTFTASKVIKMTMEGTLIVTGSLIKTAKKVVAGTLNVSGTLTKYIKKTFTGVLTVTGHCHKLYQMTMEGTLIVSGALIKIPKKILTGALTIAGTLTKKAKKIVTGTLTVIGTLTKLIKKTFLGTLTVGGTFTKICKMTIEGTLTVAGSFSHFISYRFPRFLDRVILLIRDKK